MFSDRRRARRAIRRSGLRLDSTSRVRYWQGDRGRDQGLVQGKGLHTFHTILFQIPKNYKIPTF